MTKGTLILNESTLKDDLITISQFIQSLSPNYKLYLRRYSWSLVDLVLYAI